MQSFYNENGINIIQMDEENMNPARGQHMSPARGKGINSFTEFKVSAKMINNYFQDYLNKVDRSLLFLSPHTPYSKNDWRSCSSCYWILGTFVCRVNEYHQNFICLCLVHRLKSLLKILCISHIPRNSST